MENIFKFNPLDVHKLSTEDLAGLSCETIFVGNSVRPFLGILGTTAFPNYFLIRMTGSRKQSLPHIIGECLTTTSSILYSPTKYKI
jgi:hypothetical protein